MPTVVFIILGIVFLLLATTRFFLYGKDKTFFSAFKSVKVLFATGILTIMLSILWTIFSLYYQLEVSNANEYSNDLTYLTKMVLLSDTAVYEDTGKPNYIGKKVKPLIFKEKDTLVPTATFTKGGGITGNNYISFSNNGKIYWILDKTLMKLFVYTYTYQPWV